MFKDGSSEVEIYTVTGEAVKKVFTSNIKLKKGVLEDFEYHTSDAFGSTYKASIYTAEEVNKSDFTNGFGAITTDLFMVRRLKHLYYS
ncbi:hypothetical protein N7U66_07485 [Lacinutrix neustonica]|uniref:Uncharacterized protein n=1 Tax=Lacinutrix neustonica TaxID=2980107 RepID=A0A9E8SEM3_9FLAO|nr:hypothetical protein [Lacinutrix neustonica]WAC03366.1 hypothetical protein N7U66_07485 [Lacinutrix neustonica]